MAQVTNDQEFLEYLIKALVDHPDEVKIDRKVDEMGVLLSLRRYGTDHRKGRFYRKIYKIFGQNCRFEESRKSES